MCQERGRLLPGSFRAANAKTDRVGSVTAAQVADIVRAKFEDLNARDHEHAALMIRGTARSMGIEVLD